VGDKVEKNEMGRTGSVYGGVGGVYSILVGKHHLGDPDIDGMIILRWIFRKWDVGVWNESSRLRKGTGGGHL
jgi:hypothetical protein